MRHEGIIAVMTAAVTTDTEGAAGESAVRFPEVSFMLYGEVALRIGLLPLVASG